MRDFIRFFSALKFITKLMPIVKSIQNKKGHMILKINRTLTWTKDSYSHYCMYPDKQTHMHVLDHINEVCMEKDLCTILACDDWRITFRYKHQANVTMSDRCYRYIVAKNKYTFGNIFWAFRDLSNTKFNSSGIFLS